LKGAAAFAVSDGSRHGEESVAQIAQPTRAAGLLERYRQIRDLTLHLCQGLAPEDCVVQSMPDVSPTKWHLAHTTWFFETFILKKWKTGYQTVVPEYGYLFNSYYNAAGEMHRRDLRGLISRPTLAETYRYRASVDACVTELLEDADEQLLEEMEPVLVLGFHHEQQHQELLVTDIKHVFAQNPLHPIFIERKTVQSAAAVPALKFFDYDEAIVSIGHDGRGFSYDNEGPRHRALVPAFRLANRPVTNGNILLSWRRAVTSGRNSGFR
jgi:ergothioneine biosynthesis protein EgtB